MLKFQAEITDMLVLAEITAVPAGCFVEGFTGQTNAGFKSFLTFSFITFSCLRS